MAKISHSDRAPDEAVEYSFAAGSFVLSPGESHETDDRALLAGARTHPWLVVEYDQAELLGGAMRDTLANHPELDAFTQEGPNADEAFDPEAIQKLIDEREAIDDSALAIDANLDQGEAVTLGTDETHEVDVTLAADEDHEPAADAENFTPVDPPDPNAPIEPEEPAEPTPVDPEPAPVDPEPDAPVDPAADPAAPVMETKPRRGFRENN